MTVDETTLAAKEQGETSVEEKVVVDDRKYPNVCVCVCAFEIGSSFYFVISESWWPPETRDFDVDHDDEAAKVLCEKTKLKVTIPN